MEKDKRLIKLKPTVHQKLLDIAEKRGVAIGDVIEYVLQKWEDLRVFDDIPCKYCTRPMHWKRNQVLEMTKDWSHALCEPKN